LTSVASIANAAPIERAEGRKPLSKFSVMTYEGLSFYGLD